MGPRDRIEAPGRTRRRIGGLSLAGVALLILGGCSAVEAPIRWYRDATGVSKNDDMGSNSNQKNLESGSKEPYPNLAEVPQAPDRAMSSSEREALRQSLAADRQNAHYTQDQLQAGSAVPGMVAPPAPAAAPPAIASPQPTVAKTTREAPPAESSLASPQIAALPQGETPQPPPPAPQVTPSPPIAESSLPRPAPQQPASGAQSSAAPSSAQGTAPAASAPPPPPKLAATEAPPRPTGPAVGSSAAHQMEVADVTFAPDSSQIPSALHGTLAEVASLHQQHPGKIRIVGYAQKTRGASTKDDLLSYNLALERAKSVSASLSDLGIPPGDLAVEAAVEAMGDARAEIYMNK
jgi:outer membrane protein OmpA-like peptidoglycan-associated protein